MAATKQIITAITAREFQQLQGKAAGALIVIKFGAEWCKPCKLIKSTWEEWVQGCNANIIYADIDIDESMDLYMAFKSKKMIKGVPTIMAFDMRKSRDQWYIPDDSVVGGDIGAVSAFLQRCSAA